MADKKFENGLDSDRIYGCLGSLLEIISCIITRIVLIGQLINTKKHW